MTLKPCLQCGELSEAARCPLHRTTAPRASRQERGYVSGWDALSKRARLLQPWCLDCGGTESLSADHTPRAWARAARRLPVRLCDVVVLCGGCNASRGSSRPGTERYAAWEAEDGDVRAKTPETWGVDPAGRAPVPGRIAESGLFSLGQTDAVPGAWSVDRHGLRSASACILLDEQMPLLAHHEHDSGFVRLLDGLAVRVTPHSNDDSHAAHLTPCRSLA